MTRKIRNTAWDMTVGSPAALLLRFGVPLLIGNVFQQLYSMADAVIVGKFVGTKGLAAVGATGTITFLIIGFLMGLTTGFTVLTSQKFGAGRMDEMRKTVGNAAILSAVIAVVMTAVSRWECTGCLFLCIRRRTFLTGHMATL